MSRLDEMQHEFVERHNKDADLIECYPPPPKGNGKVARVIYLSPVYKADELARQFFCAVRDTEGIAGGGEEYYWLKVRLVRPTLDGDEVHVQTVSGKNIYPLRSDLVGLH